MRFLLLLLTFVKSQSGDFILEDATEVMTWNERIEKNFNITHKLLQIINRRNLHIETDTLKLLRRLEANKSRFMTINRMQENITKTQKSLQLEIILCSSVLFSLILILCYVMTSRAYRLYQVGSQNERHEMRKPIVRRRLNFDNL